MTENRSSAYELGDEVREGLGKGAPVVALESAVFSHGLPAPENLHAVASMEEAVRASDAIPATCLVYKGRLWVGAAMELATKVAQDPDRHKISVRELGMAVALGQSGGLTVSATLQAATLAGIEVFATGGIGGVHRGDLMDVSADLRQLASSAVITVCSGVKSVLDIPRTLELLETLAVPVVGFRTEEFPAFYLQSSGHKVPKADSPRDVASIFTAQRELGRASGLLVANPIPPAVAIDEDEWEEWLAQAEAAARAAQVRGKEVTPFLLGRVAELSGGRTVAANVALLESNARLAGEIARTLKT